VFSLTGDVTRNAVSFTGQSSAGTAVFNTNINQSIITSKTNATDSLTTDTLLVYRTGTGLLQMTKQVFFNHIATIPVGTILPFAGITPPTGYLLCDGSEVLIATYATLYSVIGYTYKAAQLLQGAATFAIPDFRGRFALGKDNMNNSLSVPYKDNSGTLVSAGGGTASRVTDITGSTLGASSGTQGVTLTTSNIPDHRHNLNSGVAQYYAAGLPGATADYDFNFFGGLKKAKVTFDPKMFGVTSVMPGMINSGSGYYSPRYNIKSSSSNVWGTMDKPINPNISTIDKSTNTVSSKVDSDGFDDTVDYNNDSYVDASDYAFFQQKMKKEQENKNIGTADEILNTATNGDGTSTGSTTTDELNPVREKQIKKNEVIEDPLKPKKATQIKNPNDKKTDFVYLPGTNNKINLGFTELNQYKTRNFILN
jgi:microcystin-dependent protein